MILIISRHDSAVFGSIELDVDFMHQQLLITRPQVADRINQSLLRHPLVVLNAPVGYGKTILAQEVMSHFDPTGFPGRAATFYMSVNCGESDPEHLWERHAAILTAQKSPLSAILERFGNPFSMRNRSEVIKKVGQITSERPVLLVIDDFHFVVDERYSAFFSRIIKAGLPGLRFLILSRARPNLLMDEMRLKGQCQVFGTQTLAFSLAEAATLLTGLGLEDEDSIQRVWANSEGWPAALRLETEAYLQTGRPAADYIYYDLFERCFFGARDQAEKSLLLKLSIWDEFTEDQAMFISGHGDIAQALSNLMADNSFLNFNQDTGTYRFHGLFRSFCQARLRAAPPEMIDQPGLYRCAEKWCREHGDPAGAARFWPQTRSDQDIALVKANQPKFTAREKQIIDLVIKGLNNRQIAESLAIQRVTVTKALSNVYRKLDVKNRTQAISRLLSP